MKFMCPGKMFSMIQKSSGLFASFTVLLGTQGTQCEP